MGYGVKVSLPGYDALDDTDKDHFALWVDSDDVNDSVLIKEHSRGGFSLVPSFSTPHTINHNLGYIPMFLIYANYQNRLGLVGVPSNKWVLVPHLQITGSVQPFYVTADTSNIYVWNYDNVPDGVATDFKYYVFYDNVAGSSAQSISESDYVFKVSKTGVDAEVSTNPNDYIFHSDLNTFKILKEGVGNITYTGDGLYTVAHGLSSYTPTSSLMFIQFPDGYSAMLPGLGIAYSRDGEFNARMGYIDSTNIAFYLYRVSGSATALKVKYYIFETPL
jgi:hypothetical protein